MVNLIKNSKLFKIPAYYQQFYAKFYENEKICNYLDNDKMLYVLTTGLYPQMVNDVAKEINASSMVLQMGCTFGSQIEAVTDKLGSYGKYDIIDISKKQLARCQNKNVYQKINFEFYDARCALSQKYNVIICFLLLHELPAVSRSKVINNALDSLQNGGKAIFIEYHKPSKFNPLWWFIRAFNRIYQPFAEDLWKYDLKKYTINPKKYSWRRKIYRGGAYQKIVVTKPAQNIRSKISNPNFY